MYDHDVPLDEYDLVGAEGGFFSALGGFVKGAVKTLIPGPIDDVLIDTVAGRFFGGDDEEEARLPLQLPQTTSGCNPPMVFDPAYGGCVFPSSPGEVSVGGQVPGTYGAALMGRYGAAMVPLTTSAVRRRCPPGAVLGKDNLCYNRRDLRKGERKWNPGRKPLFTGGDLNAITRAHQLEKKAAAIARKLGYSVKSKAAAAGDREKMKALRKRARGRKSPDIDIDIDT